MEAPAQNANSPGFDSIVKFSSRPQSDYTAEFRAAFAQTVASFCQEVLDALPTNTPAEDAWVISEQKTKDVPKFLRVLRSKEYNRSALRTTFADCKDTATVLVEMTHQLSRGTERFEAGQFVQLALTFNTFFEPYFSGIDLNKDVKVALGDLQMHVIRAGLLRAARQALQDVDR